MSRAQRIVWISCAPVGVVVATLMQILSDSEEPLGRFFGVTIAACYLASGMVIWKRRPDGVVGPLLVAAAFAWLIFPNVDVPVLFSFTFGWDGADIPLLFHAVMAYPGGHLRSTTERAILATMYSTLAFRGIVLLLTAEPPSACSGCTTHAPFRNEQVATGIDLITSFIGAILAITVVVIIVRRLVNASPARRIALIELWIAGLGLAAFLLGVVVTFMLGDEVTGTHFWVGYAARLAIPLALAVGAFRMELSRAAVGGLVLELSARDAPADLRESLARALRDPTLQVAYWIPDRGAYVDVDGREVALSGEASNRAVTKIDREGRRLAVLIHDPALLERPDLVKAAGAAAGLALENARLHAEILLQLEEVRASRARIVEAADSERIRIERDLHDGAQQRLLALSMALRETHRKIGGDGAAARASLDAALGELSSALSELRELARGVYPAILSEDGLGPALESLARRAVVPTTVNLDLPQRPADVSERTAYFVVSEGLANIAKHAQASEAVVTASILGEMLFLEVRDDGLGGADPGRGSGLRGLADRVAAVGGHLRIESSKGNGTRLIAEIPCG